MPIATDTTVFVETLSTISEFSIGLAGFSGVAAALMRRSSAVSEFDRMRITVNICLSLTPGFVAFLTLSLINFGSSALAATRSGAGAIIAFYLVILAVLPVIRKRAGSFQRFNPIALGILILTTWTNLPLQLYNCIVLPENASGILVAGLSMILLAGASTFAGLLWQMLGYDPAQSKV